MSEAIDKWLYDSVNEAAEDAEARLSKIFRSAPGFGVIGNESKEEDFGSDIEQQIDGVIERFCRRCTEIFGVKSDVHTISIISFELDRVRSLAREGLVGYQLRTAGKHLRDQLVLKISDDLNSLRDILLQKLSGFPTVDPDTTVHAKTSSSWTGRRSPRELVRVIKQIGPSVLDGLALLISAVEEQRLNEPDARKTLDEARLLHSALGELLRRADVGEQTESLTKAFEHFRTAAISVLTNRWSFFAASPVLTMGTVSALHGMSSQPFDGGAIATIWGGWVAAKLVSERR